MTITFDGGRVVALDGETVTLAEALLLAGQRARAHGLVRPGASVRAAGAAVLAAARRELGADDGTVRVALGSGLDQQERRVA
jgi:hypothetical protein